MFKLYTLYMFEHKIEKVELEVSFSRGLPGVYIVGLPGKVVEEASIRIKEGILNENLEFPETKIIINLSPANINKKSPLFDLPIAISILINDLLKEYKKKIKKEKYEQFQFIKTLILNFFKKYLILGEIGIDGSIKKNGNLFPFLLNAKNNKFQYILFPEDNYYDFVPIIKNHDLTLLMFKSIKEVFFYFKKVINYFFVLNQNGIMENKVNTKEDKWKNEVIEKIIYKIENFIENENITIIENLKKNNLLHSEKIDLYSDKSSIKIKKFTNQNKKVFENKLEDFVGGYDLKRGLLIAAAGFHNILIKGPSGVGKSFLSKCLIEILPPLTFKEKVELTNLYALLGNLDKNKLINKRFVRIPHHTTSVTSMVGGGTKLIPGEVTLAHRGLLILDEVNLFKRAVIESLREPISENCVIISKYKTKIILPSMFLIAIIHNLCPCGNYGSNRRTCVCTPYEILSFNKKLSNSIIDRIDIILNVEDIDFDITINNNINNINEKMNKYTNINNISNNNLNKNKNTSINNLINNKGNETNINYYSSQNLYEIVKKVQKIQIKRYENDLDYFNGKVKREIFFRKVKLNKELENYLKMQTKNLQISFRKIEKIIRIARTIADIEGNKDILKDNINEAIYFVKDEKIKLTLS